MRCEVKFWAKRIRFDGRPVWWIWFGDKGLTEHPYIHDHAPMMMYLVGCMEGLLKAAYEARPNVPDPGA